MVRLRLAPVCMVILLGAGAELGCARHMVVERDQVEALNQREWTILSAPESTEKENETGFQEDGEARTNR